MDLPIQLKFFKKLDLYQELRSQNEKALGRDRAWPMEKMILKWTVWNHHHLSTPLRPDVAFTHPEIVDRTDQDNFPLLLEAMRNLVEREYATYASNLALDRGIKFTRAGLLMGEVIDDVEGSGEGTWSAWRYIFFIILVWAVAIAGALLVIVNFFDALGPIAHALFPVHPDRWHRGF
jgi:hypothetical protein